MRVREEPWSVGEGIFLNLFFSFERELADDEAGTVGKLTHLPPGTVYNQGNPRRSNIQVFKYRWGVSFKVLS